MLNSFTCLNCDNTFTNNCNCTDRRCTRCGSYNVLTDIAKSKLDQLKTKCSNCTHFKHVAIVASVPFNVCNINCLDISKFILCPINKW